MFFFFFQAEDGIRDKLVTGVQTCALPISGWGPDLRDAGLSSQRLGHGQAHARAAGVARPSATGGVRARQGCLGSRRCHKCPVAGCQQGRRSRSARDRLAQPSPEASHRSRHTLGGNMQRGANARFAIKHWDEKPYSEGKDVPKLTRASVTKTFTGDIEGEGQVEYLMMYRSDGSATFVGFERVVGRLAGKAGSFVLQRTGVFEAGVAKESYSVVPGSGTGELRGLRGEGATAVGHGMEHPMTLTYDLG